MADDFKKLVEGAESYEFDPKRLDALQVSGTLRKSDDAATFILVLSSTNRGDLTAEIRTEDVLEHEAEGDRVTLHVKPTAVVSTTFTGRITGSPLVEAGREPLPEVPWRTVVTPFSAIDRLLHFVSLLGWHECRAAVVERCERLHPPGPARDQCITDGYIGCGEKPALRVSARVLDQLVDLFRGPDFPPRR